MCPRAAAPTRADALRAFNAHPVTIFRDEAGDFIDGWADVLQNGRPGRVFLDTHETNELLTLCLADGESVTAAHH